MKSRKSAIITVIVSCALMVPVLAGAAESAEGSGWRPVWDAAWKWINFGILVFVIVKYGRKPLVGFLKKYSSDIGERFGSAKDLLDSAQAEFSEAEKRLANIEKEISNLQAAYEREAEGVKQKLLEDAQRNSDHLMEEARLLAENNLKLAKEKVKAELVQLAVEEAEKLIRKTISDDDQKRMVSEYLGEIEQANPA